MQQAMQEMIRGMIGANGTSLYADDPYQDAYCCIRCKKEFKREELPSIFGENFRPLPVCKCAVQRHEEERRQQERLHRKKQLKKVYGKSIMNADLKKASFDNFEQRPGTELAFSDSKKFVEDFETRKTGIVLFGNVGNGKSHLCAAIHHEIDRRGYVSLFLDCSQLFNLAKDTMHRNSRITITDIITAAVECDLLTLDEIGSGSLTEYEFNDILFPIINGRQGKKTNYTTNLNLDRLEEWFKKDKHGKPLDIDGRLFDRILGSCDVLQNKGTSKRKEEAMKRLGG